MNDIFAKSGAYFIHSGEEADLLGGVFKKLDLVVAADQIAKSNTD